MNKTESPNTELLTRFYHERILPLAQDAAAGSEVFPLGADADCASYFSSRSDGETYIHSIDSDDLEAELAKLWANDPIEEMAGIAAPLLAVADVLHEKEQTSDEISPFIYAMF